MSLIDVLRAFQDDPATEAIVMIGEIGGTDEEKACLLYTSDAADERSSVDLGGRRILKKKTIVDRRDCRPNVYEQRQRIHNITYSITKQP